MQRSRKLKVNFALLSVITLAGLVWKTSAAPDVGNFLTVASPALRRAAEAEPAFKANFLHEDPGVASVHAGSMARLPDGGLLAAWFGGSREGAKDVCIYAARCNGEDWSVPQAIASREDTTRDLNLYVKKLGNPVLFVDSNDRVWMYYVAVSVGGWSGSFIATKHSDDFGVTWSTAQRLITSPTLNISTMVKGLPYETDSGFIALPVYHECINVFPELAWLDLEGNLIRKDRTSQHNGTFQPSLLINGSQLQAYHRRCWDTPKRVLTNHASPQWRTWSEMKATNIPNSGAAVAVLNRHHGGFLMVANPLEEGRSRLTICVSDDGLDWREVFDLEKGRADEGYSYPYIIHGANNDYHVIYTWKRERMKQASFNEAWLRGLL